ncbi:uncharacterized protein TNCV_4349411 [Trichonephila clavipes]|nr:uncharacterized protein TNCV_4349411 [Trichonephila clavipes]
MDLVILKNGQMTRATPELAPPLLTTTPHQREDISALDRFNVHRCPTRRVFRGTGKNSLWSVFEASLVGRKNPCCPVGGLNSQRYISEVLEPVVLPYLQGLAPAIFNRIMREHMGHALSKGSSSITSTPTSATPDQKLLGLLYPKNTSKVSLNQCRGVSQR